jgi:hypothetical protein
MAAAISSTPSVRFFSIEKPDKSKIDLTIRRPTAKEREYADLEKAATFNRSLMAGLPLRQRMLRELRKNDLWGDTQEKEFDSLRTSVLQTNEAIKVILPEGTKEIDLDGQHEAELSDLRKTRNDATRRLNELRGDVEAMLSQTADAKADEAEQNFLLACVVEYASGANKGKRLWSSVQDMLGESDADLFTRISYEAMTFSNGIPSDWTNFIKSEEEKQQKTEDAPPAPPAEQDVPPPPAPAVTPPVTEPATSPSPLPAIATPTVAAAVAATAAPAVSMTQIE